MTVEMKSPEEADGFAELLNARCKVQQADAATVWAGEVVAMGDWPTQYITLRVRERGDDDSRDIVMPVASIVRLWRA